MRFRVGMLVVCALMLVVAGWYALDQVTDHSKQQACWNDGSCRPPAAATIQLVSGQPVAVPKGVESDADWTECEPNCTTGIQALPYAFQTHGKDCRTVHFEGDVQPVSVFASSVKSGGQYTATLRQNGPTGKPSVELCQTEEPPPVIGAINEKSNYALLWTEPAPTK